MLEKLILWAKIGINVFGGTKRGRKIDFGDLGDLGDGAMGRWGEWAT